MTRSHQKFDLGPKLSLRVQLKGLSINKKYRVLISASQQRELYLNNFHPFCYVSDGLRCRIGDALTQETHYLLSLLHIVKFEVFRFCNIRI
jgi:hypothetical protein